MHKGKEAFELDASVMLVSGGKQEGKSVPLHRHDDGVSRR